MSPLQTIEVSFLAIATAGYAVAWVVHVWALRAGGQELSRRATVATQVAFALHVAWFVLRVYRAGRLPIFNAHEFSAMFGGGIVFFYLIFERRSRRRELAVYALPAALGLLGYGWKYSSNVEPLIPVFRSSWLTFHILTALIAYSAFATTFAASCLYLFSRARSSTPSPADDSSGAARLDTIAYQAATVGFSFLTVCVITGAIWAEYVWGRFWSWDPKETWSLITWLVFAAYLHTRYNRGWKESRAAVLGIVGFLLVLMTYLGVELLSPGQHDFLLWRRE